MLDEDDVPTFSSFFYVIEGTVTNNFVTVLICFVTSSSLMIRFLNSLFLRACFHGIDRMCANGNRRMSPLACRGKVSPNSGFVIHNWRR